MMVSIFMVVNVVLMCDLVIGIVAFMMMVLVLTLKHKHLEALRRSRLRV